MIRDQYVWLVWPSAFLVPWAALYIAFPLNRKTMAWSSLFTMPFGLTEPRFVPDYWNPPAWAVAFGLCWSGVYEHFTWRWIVAMKY